MFRLECSNLKTVSALVLVLLLGVPDASEAASTSYVIDFSFPFEPRSGSSLGVQGEFLEAARFQIDSDLLPADTITFVPYARLDGFSLSVSSLSLGQQAKDGGNCLTGARLPCGLLFIGMEPLSLVGQFSIPDPSGRFNFRFDNTGPGLVSSDPLFQGVSIEDLASDVRTTVASGFATIRRPVPEPCSMLLLATGGAAVGQALRRRRRPAAA